MKKVIKRRPAVKEAMTWDELVQGAKNPLQKGPNGEYNYGGAALLGGGSALATYIVSKLLGLKNGPSLVASLLGGLGGAHYAMGKQQAGNGQYNPWSIEWLRDVLNKFRQKQQPEYSPKNLGPEKIPVTPKPAYKAEDLTKPDTMPRTPYPAHWRKQEQRPVLSQTPAPQPAPTPGMGPNAFYGGQQ